MFGRFDLAALCGCHTLKFVMLCYVDIGEEAANMRGGVGGGMGCMENASSMGCISDSDIEEREEPKSMEGSVDGGRPEADGGRAEGDIMG